MRMYWEEFPPVHVLLHMITEGLAGTRIGAESPKREKSFAPTPAAVLLKELGTSG